MTRTPQDSAAWGSAAPDSAAQGSAAQGLAARHSALAPQRPGWPLFAGLGPLGALPSAPRLARAFTRLVLAGWGLGSLADDGELIASELTSNVICAATGDDGHPRYDERGRLPLLWLRLLSDHARLRIESWDNVPLDLGVPLPRHAGDTDESGRGLELIRELSTDWGWDHLPAHDAKRVWALLAA